MTDEQPPATDDRPDEPESNPDACPTCGALPSEPCGLGPGATGYGMTSCGPEYD